MTNDMHVKIWLYTVTGLILLMVVVGGLTRLTDSGLSIVEWAPIAGAIPPLTQADWLYEFEKYKTISEYQRQNAGMSLDEFKVIYWWEWGHRQLGRLIGFAFAVPLLVFLINGKLRGGWAVYMIVLLMLGGMQGFVGWFMVESGVVEDRLDVSPYRLAMHLGLAVIVLGLVYHAARSWDLAGRSVRTNIWPLVFLGFLYLQIISGAFVAGTDAGMIYNSWPLMENALVPEGLYSDPTPIRASFEDHLTVQFNHRILAYFVFALGLFAAWKVRDVMPKHALLLSALLVLQVILGIITLVTVAAYDHIWLAASHQLLGVLLYLVAVDLVARSYPIRLRLGRAGDLGNNDFSVVK